MTKYLILVAVLGFSSLLYSQNTPCVDAGPDCTNTESSTSNGTFNTSYGGVYTQSQLEEQANASSDDCSSPNAAVWCGGMDPETEFFLEADAVFTGAAIGGTIASAPDFLGTSTLFGGGGDAFPYGLSENDLLTIDAENSFGLGSIGAGNQTNPLVGPTAEEAGSLPESVTNYINKLDPPPGSLVATETTLGETIINTTLKVYGVVGMVIGSATIMGNATLSGNMNYSSIGSHMQPESGSVPSSIYGNSNPMSAFAPRNPPCMFSQGGC